MMDGWMDGWMAEPLHARQKQKGREGGRGVGGRDWKERVGRSEWGGRQEGWRFGGRDGMGNFKLRSVCSSSLVW